MGGVIIFENLMLYQILAIIIAIVAILLIFDRFHKKKTSFQTFILWVVLWIVLTTFAIIQESSTFLANMIGIGRYLDLVIIFGIIGSYYLILRLYLKFEKIDQEITELVRKITMDKELNYELKFNEDKED